MNIESTSTVKTAETTSSTTASSSSSSSKAQDSKSFKEELDSVKKQENSAATTEAKKTQDENTKVSENESANQTENTKNSAQNASSQVDKKNLAQAEDKKSNLFGLSEESEKVTDPINALQSKIEAVKSLKGGKDSSLLSSVKEVKTSDDSLQSIKMDKADASFFLNLVENQQAQVQIGTDLNAKSNSINFNDAKTQATQQTSQVSSTLLDALQKSMETNKSFRIDFDNNVAVVMKVDKNGVLSANFIPGDAAVENYLRNNIQGLKQSFEQQNLPYNELSYSRQQNREQQQNNNKNKENKDE